MIWVINLNSNICRIYHYEKLSSRVTLIKEISHPELKMKTGDIFTSDKPGHYQSSNGAHGTYSPRTDPKEVEVDNFAREIARELNQGRNDHRYDHLIIISAPHMSGLLQQHLDKHVNELVTSHIHKDLLHLKEHELVDFLTTHPV